MDKNACSASSHSLSFSFFPFLAEENVPRRFGTLYICSEAKHFIWGNLDNEKFSVCFWSIFNFIPKGYLILAWTFWPFWWAILSFYSIWFPKLSEWLQGDLWAVQMKQVRRGMTSCHPRSCLLSAASNTDTLPRNLLFAPLNPPTAPSLRPPSVRGRKRKRKGGMEGGKDGRSFLRGARRRLVADAIWQKTQELKGILFSLFKYL